MAEATVGQGSTVSYVTSNVQRESPQNPYVGPRTFTFADRNWYFGRTHEARDLLALVISERLTLFYAQSGAGKSSLLNTEIIPALREEARYLVLPVGRVGGELPAGISDVANIYTFNLLLSLDQSEEDDSSRFAAMTLREFMQGLRTSDGKRYIYDAATAQRAAELPSTGQSTVPNQPPHVLIIDQFEELVTTHPQRWREREAFFQQLGDAMRADPLLWVVLTLREDFIAALDPFAYHVPGHLTNRFYMQRMGVDAALEAVKRPAAQAGRPFAEGVAEILVDNLRRIKVAGQENEQLGQYVEPVQLQVVCYQLWENLVKHHGDFSRTREGKTPEITRADLQQAGDVDTALADFYEDAVRSALQDQTVTVSERELRAWFDKQLITEAGTRGTVYYGDRTTATMDNRVVDRLQRRFLLRAELRAGGIWVELVHDRFVEPIRAANQAWLQRQSPLLRAAQAWEAAQRTSSLLLSQQQLAALQAEITFESSDSLVAAFVSASKDEVKAIADREAAERRERELSQAQAIAKEADARRRVEALRAQEAEARRRAEEQTAARLRKFVVSLALLGTVALVAAVAAAVFGYQTVQLNQTVQARATEVAAERDSVQTAEAEAQNNEELAVAAKGTADAERRSAVGLADSLAAVLTAQAPTLTPDVTTTSAVISNGDTEATRIILIPTPVPTPNIGATATFAAAQAQLVQVQATQTAVASPKLFVVVPDIVVSVNAAPSVNANSIETVRAPTKLPVVDVTDDFWIGVELPDGRQGWVYGYIVFFEGERSSLPAELRNLVISNRDDLPFVQGVVTSWFGAAGDYLLADPANEQTEIRWVPVGTTVTLLEEGTGSDGYGSRIWYLVALPDPNGTNQLLKGWLPKEVLAESIEDAAIDQAEEDVSTGTSQEAESVGQIDPYSSIRERFVTDGYIYEWNNGTALVTNVQWDGTQFTIQYDHREGMLTGKILPAENNKTYIYQGNWIQGQDQGNFELVFTADFSFAEGWWNHGGDTPHEAHFLILIE